MPIQTDHLGRFWCETLRCWIMPKGCVARYELGRSGKSKRMREGPCGPRCNVGTALAADQPLPDGFEVQQREAPPTVASRDKAWGHAVCQNPDCPREGKPYRKHSGNHLIFCTRRCAKRAYRPYRPPAPGLAELQAVMKGY